jgi:hypothetical protein
MALVGNLRDFGLAEFLYLVDRGYKTGRLTLQKPGDRAELYFQHGKLVYATHFNQDDRIGDILVRMGRLSREQLNAALRIQHVEEPNKPLGAILVQRQMVSLEEIHKCVRMQIEEITYSLFAWNEGDFRFEQDMQPPPESVTIPLSIENIIMEGSRRIDEWNRIKDRIPNLDVVVRFSDQPQEKARGVNLTPDEWRVFARINGLDSIRQIAQKTALGEFDVARIIYGFLSAGLVTLVKSAQPPGEARGPRVGATNPNMGANNGAAAAAGGRYNQMAGRAATAPVNGARPDGATRSATGPGGVVYDARPKKSVIRRLIDYFRVPSPK